MLTAIRQISFTPINKKTTPLVTGPRMIQGLACDTVSFGNSEFLSKPKEEIFAQIKQSVSNSRKNCLGHGGEAYVYRIEGTDYCVRVPTKLVLDGLNLKKITLKVSEKDKVNHTVAKLNDGITIMPVIEGEIFGESFNPELLKVMESMPQKAYDELLQQFCRAYKQGLEFDATWKNIIVNPKNSTMTAIDFYEPDVLCRRRFLNEAYHALAEHRFATPEYKKICAGRLYLGALKLMDADSKLTPEVLALGADEFSYLLKKEKLLENEKYYKVLGDKFKKLENLKIEQLRRKKSPEVVQAVNFQIKVIKSLIKQLFNVV